MKVISTLFSLVFLVLGCEFSRPLSGQGYDSSAKKVKGDPDREVVIAITSAYLNRDKRGPFDDASQSIYKNMNNYPGYIAGSIRLQALNKRYGPIRFGENEESLNGFINSREHLDAMYMTDSAISKMRSIRLKLAAKDVPTDWEQIKGIINQYELKEYKKL